MEAAKAVKQMQRATKKLEEEKLEILAVNRIIYHLDSWIDQPSLLLDETFCENIFRRSINEAISLNVSEKSKMQLQEAHTVLDSRLRTTKIELEKIHAIITGFQSSINSHMRVNTCFPQDQMLIELQQNMTKKYEGKLIETYAGGGCEKLITIYIADNEQIIATEESLLGYAAEEIFNAYHVQLSKITSTFPLHSDQLSQLNLKLLEVCLSKLRYLQPNHPYNIDKKSFIHLGMESKLKGRMKQIYKELRHSNTKKMEEISDLIKLIILRHIAKYCSEMEKIMEQSTNSIPSETLFNHNVAVRNIENKMFCKEIQKMIRLNEPTDGYLMTLECNIDSAWLSFQDLNNQKLGIQTENHLSAALAEKKALPPIIFQLSLSQIGTYIHQAAKLLDLGFSSTTVAETSDGLLLCEFQNANVYNQHILERSWNLSDCLFPEKQSGKNGELKFGDTSYKVGTELILGLLLHKLKQRVENHLNGEAKTCVITVPFWLTSQQRQQIKNSGNVAGFQETYLINENSAIALYIWRTSYEEEENDFVVLSENSGRVDTTIYACDKRTGVLKITGHRGDYQFDSKNASISENARETYNFAQEMSDDKIQNIWNPRSKTVAISNQAEEFKNPFVDIGKEISTTHSVRGISEELIIQGALLFCQNLGSKQALIQDCWSTNVFRKIGSGPEKLIQEKNNNNPMIHLEAQSLSTGFTVSNETVYFFQKDVNGQRSPIADIKFDPSMCNKWTEINLIISNESIVTITPMNITNKVNILSYGMMDDKQIAAYFSLFESSQILELENQERVRRKKEVVAKGNALLDLANKVPFKSPLAQDMALHQIKSALKSLDHPRITVNDMEKQSRIFKTYEEKFSSQH